MQLSQLQGIIQECKKIVNKNERIYADEQRLNRQASLFSKEIRKRRIELTKLKYEVKRNVKLQKQSKQEQESIQGLRRQLKDNIAIKNKELQSYKKISTIIENLQRQIDTIDKKINDDLNQIEKQVKQDELIIRHNQRQLMYLKLKKQLQVKSASNRKHNEDLSINSRERLKNISPVNELIGKLDLKYQQICQKIQVQREIINEIFKYELINKSNNIQSAKTKTQIDTLQQNVGQHFKKTEELNPFQKIEITNILMRQQYKKEQEDHKMGQIVRQNIMNKYNIGRIVNNRNKFNYNLTEISKIGHSAIIKQSFQNSQNLDYSSYNARLKKLEASKRVRTRQTQMRRYSNQYRNILLNHSQDKNDIEPLPSHNILDVYNELKKAQSDKNKIGNIEIIKVMKYNKKKKRLSNERGGGLQICDQY